jgi:hypothetical protein
MAEVFISYARADQGFARDLHAALQKIKRDAWIDWRSIPDTAKWRAEIFAAIEAADNFLFIISPDSLHSRMCGLEVAHAVANNKRLITILYHPVDHKELLTDLDEIQWINYPELGFEPTFQRLITAIDTDLDWVRQHTWFGLRAMQWEASGRDNGFLLRGMELKEAVRWLEQAATIKSRQPTGVHELYIRASEEWEAGEKHTLKESKDKREQPWLKAKQNIPITDRPLAALNKLLLVGAIMEEDGTPVNSEPSQVVDADWFSPMMTWITAWYRLQYGNAARVNSKDVPPQLEMEKAFVR